MRNLLLGVALTVSTAFAATPPPTREAPSFPRPMVVDFAPGEGPATADRLAADGVSVLSFLPPSSFLVLASGDFATTEGLRVTPWDNRRAVSPELRDLTAKRALLANRSLPVLVGLAHRGAIADFTSAAVAAGGEVTWTREQQPVPQIGLKVAPEKLAELLELVEATPELVWADVQPGLRALNHNSAWRVQSGPAQTRPIHDHGLAGENQIIAIADSGIDIDSCFFADPSTSTAINGADGTTVNPDHRKVQAVNFYWDQDWPEPRSWSWDSHGHGSHVAGSAAGDGNGDGLFDGIDGIAPAARLVIQDGGFAADDCTDFPGFGCPVHPYEPMLQQAWDQGARIHSNSYGDEENFVPHNRYTERTADMDRFVWNHKEFVIVAAAGNAGPGSGTVISPSTGKNVISVGATWLGSFDPQCQAPYSSHGWAHDGRIKPDVLAPGSQKISAATDFTITTGNCTGAQLGGTSMATPTVAGLAALIRQYFMTGTWPSGSPAAGDAFEPSSALVRAVLVASAQDITSQACPIASPIPSPEQGWGIVQLDRALMFEDSDFQLLVDDHRVGFESSAETPWTANILHREDGPLKVVLTWTDPPSSSAAEVNLVNDLDLVVRGPDGTFLGNSFAAGRSTLGGEADRLNTTEVVWLPAASAGRWQVEISPAAVNLGAQDFALVITGSVEQLSQRTPAPTRGG